MEKISLALLSGILLLTLVGCAGGTDAGTNGAPGPISSSPAASAQANADSQEGSCTVIANGIKKFSDASTAKYAEMTNEEIAALPLSQSQSEMVQSMKEIIPSVTNEDVKAAYAEVVATNEEVIPLIEQIVSDPEGAAANEGFTELQARVGDAAAKFAELCPDLERTPSPFDTERAFSCAYAGGPPRDPSLPVRPKRGPISFHAKSLMVFI